VQWLGEVPGHWELTVLKRGISATLDSRLRGNDDTADLGNDTGVPGMKSPDTHSPPALSSLPTSVIPANANTQTVIPAQANTPAVIPAQANTPAVIPAQANTPAVIPAQANTQTVIPAQAGIQKDTQ
jgi:hypothetical protein